MGIGTQVDREDRTQQFNAITDPLAAVFKVKTGMGILAAQESPPDASGDAMVVGCIAQRDLTVSGSWHGV